MSIQNEDDNSQSTYTPGPVRSSFSIDNVTDNDSNLTANQPDDYEPGKEMFFISKIDQSSSHVDFR